MRASSTAVSHSNKSDRNRNRLAKVFLEQEEFQCLDGIISEEHKVIFLWKNVETNTQAHMAKSQKNQHQGAKWSRKSLFFLPRLSPSHSGRMSKNQNEKSSQESFETSSQLCVQQKVPFQIQFRDEYAMSVVIKLKFFFFQLHNHEDGGAPNQFLWNVKVSWSQSMGDNERKKFPIPSANVTKIVDFSPILTFFSIACLALVPLNSFIKSRHTNSILHSALLICFAEEVRWSDGWRCW